MTSHSNQIYDYFQLHIFKNCFIFESKNNQLYSDDNENIDNCLVIDRSVQSPNIYVAGIESLKENGKPKKIIECFGIIGLFHLAAGPYLSVITGRQLIGTMKGHKIYRLSKVTNFEFSTNSLNLSHEKKKYENTCLSILDNLLNDGHFYFSYTFDLTTNLQKMARRNNLIKEYPLYMQVDKQFWWNKTMLKPFRALKLDNWILPIIRGYVHVSILLIKGLCFDFVLISRRSRYRAGTRYHTRGVDEQGHVANYVETEQIIGLNDSSWSSFVQTRGSIPLFWGQKTKATSYNPKAKLTHSHAESAAAFATHFDRQLSKYSKQVIVNLLDRKGDELLLSEAFEDFLSNFNNENISYIQFDFHAYCKNNQFQNVSILLDKIADKLAAIGYARINNGQIESLQCGSIRTNCLDCLDRTNLVQSTFAKTSLLVQLESFGIIDIDGDEVVDRTFREAWTNNGDAISLQYAGTGALKSDFTRTGKRKTKGKVKDGYNALSRYVINNFKDGLRQIAIDLMLGVQQVETLDFSQMVEEEHIDKKSKHNNNNNNGEEFETDFALNFE